MGRGRSDRGASVVEYGGLVVVAALIMGALTATGVVGKVADGCRTALCQILGEKNCPLASGDPEVSGSPRPQAYGATPAGPYAGPRPPVPDPTCDPSAPWAEGLHAHNDYENEHPLDDALEHGATSVEADVWLDHGKLWVAHDKPFVQCEDNRAGHCHSDDARGTLLGTYINGLNARARENGGQIYPGRTEPFQLVVEIKSKGSHAAYEQVLKEVARLPPSVNVVISGGRPEDVIGSQPSNVSFDIPPGDGCTIPPRLDPSSPQYDREYASNFTMINGRWGEDTGCGDKNGDGEISDDEQRALDDLVSDAHAAGYRLRFWGAPDGHGRSNDHGGFHGFCPGGSCSEGQRRDAWRAQRRAGVDFLGTNHLTKGSDYIRSCSDVG